MKRKRLSWFTRAAKWASRTAGRPVTFTIAVAVILIWAITGPIFQFSDTWQLVINTGTTIITFLMIFLIQNTQNRDGVAIQTKLDAGLAFRVQAFQMGQPVFKRLQAAAGSFCNRARTRAT